MVTIYVLLCEEKKYYVGKTTNIQVRIEDHRTGNGSFWTKKYKPLNIVETIPDCDGFDEDKYVLKYMAKHGIDNVRGGSFSQIELSEEQRNQIDRMISGAEDRCFRCGQSGHFVRNCNGIIDDYFIVPKDFTTIQQNTKPKKSWWDIGFRILDKLLDDSKDKCYRCGRRGHWANNCYARRHVNGRWLG